MTAWCQRCSRSFRTTSAFQQHVRASPRHFECPVCSFDGHSWTDLLDHCRSTGCRTVCQGCDQGDGSHWANDSESYEDHLEENNVCTVCERHFNTADNLHQHRLSHRQRTYECYKCDRNFKTYSGMIIHLEYGVCSDIDEESLNMLAAECRKWRYFIGEDYRDELLEDGWLDTTDGELYPYMCPTCDTTLSKLSSLFQHIESSACQQTLDDGVIGQLRNFLASRL